MCKKLKLPVKAYIILIIMVGLQQCTSGYGQGLRCFDPVWKTLVFNKDHGFVYINKQDKHQITFTTGAESKYLYKISTEVKLRHHSKKPPETAFYLYDPADRRFLCFKNANGVMTAMTYKAINRKKLWDQCKFSDKPLNDTESLRSQAYVHLHLASDPNVKMQFNNAGKIMSQKRLNNCLKKRSTMTVPSPRGRLSKKKDKKCFAESQFLLYSSRTTKNCCDEALRNLCYSPISQMPELKSKCEEVRERGCENRLHG